MECMGFEGCMDVAMDLMDRFAKGLPLPLFLLSALLFEKQLHLRCVCVCAVQDILSCQSSIACRL